MFSNIELANAQLRVDERAGTYLESVVAGSAWIELPTNQRVRTMIAVSQCNAIEIQP